MSRSGSCDAQKPRLPSVKLCPFLKKQQNVESAQYSQFDTRVGYVHSLNYFDLLIAMFSIICAWLALKARSVHHFSALYFCKAD